MAGETRGEITSEISLQPLQDAYADDSPFAVETGEITTLDLGAWWESETISRDERKLIITCQEQGLSQTNTVKRVYNKRPGRSQKYRVAAAKVKKVYGELSLVNNNAR